MRQILKIEKNIKTIKALKAPKSLKKEKIKTSKIKAKSKTTLKSADTKKSPAKNEMKSNPKMNIREFLNLEIDSALVKADKNEIKNLKNNLLKQKSMILNKSVEFKSESLIHSHEILDEAEIATQNLKINLDLNLYERDRLALIQIDQALAKLQKGTYGQCEACSEIISVKRLKASPFASLCIDCKQEQEQPLNH